MAEQRPQNSTSKKEKCWRCILITSPFTPCYICHPPTSPPPVKRKKKPKGPYEGIRRPPRHPPEQPPDFSNLPLYEDPFYGKPNVEKNVKNRINIKKLNLSFGGCGFLGIYHVGVAAAFKTLIPGCKFGCLAGTSAGALAAACLIGDVDMSKMTCRLMHAAAESRTYHLGPWNPAYQVTPILRDTLAELLPEDIHIICSGKLFISTTDVNTGENKIFSNFNSKADLISVCTASAYIPCFSGAYPIKVRGSRVMDGGFSKNLVELEDMITVLPFAGDAHICPRDPHNGEATHRIHFANQGVDVTYKNLKRLTQVLYPPKASEMSKIMKQGFKDAHRFLRTHGITKCNQCIFVDSSATEANSEYLHRPMCKDNPECEEEYSRVIEMPVEIQPVLNRYMEACGKPHLIERSPQNEIPGLKATFRFNWKDMLMSVPHLSMSFIHLLMNNLVAIIIDSYAGQIVESCDTLYTLYETKLFHKLKPFMPSEETVYAWFNYFSDEILERIPPGSVRTRNKYNPVTPLDPSHHVDPFSNDDDEMVREIGIEVHGYLPTVHSPEDDLDVPPIPREHRRFMNPPMSDDEDVGQNDEGQGQEDEDEDDQERLDDDEDLLLEVRYQQKNPEGVSLSDRPIDKDVAIELQNENLLAIAKSTHTKCSSRMASRSTSRIQSRANSKPSSRSSSKANSMANSRAESRDGSRIGSRRNSISSTYGETSTLDNIIKVTERQDSALAWYYSDEYGRHCTWSFYDITDMDPAELVGDDALESEESVFQAQEQQEHYESQYTELANSEAAFGGARPKTTKKNLDPKEVENRLQKFKEDDDTE